MLLLLEIAMTYIKSNIECLWARSYYTHLQQRKGVFVDFYVRDEMGKGESYVAPDPHFVSSVALFASSLPWSKFRTFFERKKMVNLSANEQLILLRLVALQELLALDDDSLLRWAKHQLYLFSFMQPYAKKVSDTKIDLPNLPVNNDSSCPNCGSANVISLKPSQEASTLPNINFSKCRFCGNVYRERK